MVTLTLDWDGTASGLPEHRMSLDVWMESLQLLQRCVRRKANNLVTEQVGSGRGARGGRLHRLAKSIDLQIESVEDGCTLVHLKVVNDVQPDTQIPFDLGLIQRTVAAVVRDIQDEAEGRPRNHLARKFLQSVPEGVTRQVLEATDGGESLARAEIGVVTLVEPAVELPLVQRGFAQVLGVHFDPMEVILAPDGEERRIRCAATPSMVDQAILQRSSTVHACWVERSRGSRLLWLKQSEPAEPSRDEIRDRIERDWPVTLRILGS